MLAIQSNLTLVLGEQYNSINQGDLLCVELMNLWCRLTHNLNEYEIPNPL